MNSYLPLALLAYFLNSIAVRRSTFYKAGGFNTTLSFGEDSDFCIRLTKLGNVDLLPNAYIYTSIRRLADLGLVRFILGYAFLNQCALFLGKEPPVGHTVLRTLPKTPPRPYNPLIFLLSGPALLCILFITVSYMYTAIPKEQRPTLAKVGQIAQGKEVKAFTQQFISITRFPTPGKSVTESH